MSWKSLKELMQESLDGYGVVVSSTEPDTEMASVWIDPNGDATDSSSVIEYNAGTPEATGATASIYVDTTADTESKGIYFKMS